MPGAIAFAVANAALAAGAGVGTALAITSTLGVGLIGVGLSIGLSYVGMLLVGKPQAPKPSDVKTNIREPTQPRFRSYGLVRVGGVVAFIGRREGRLIKVLCLGQTRINAVLEHWVDDRRVTLNASGFVSSDSDGLEKNERCQIEYRLGTEDQTFYASVTSRLPDVWSPAHKGNGMPHAAMILKQPVAEDFSKVFPNGVQTRYSQVQESSILFDPRTGVSAYSENAALIIRDFLVSPWGLRMSPDIVSIADAQWIAEANVCDELVPLKGGGSERRWRIAMTYAMNERPGDVLQRMLDACDATIFPTAEGGLTIKVGRWEAPTVVLDEDTITGISGLTRGGDVLTRFNVIRAQYTSRDHDFEEVDADPWVNEELASLYGESSKDIQIFASPSHGQTRRLMKLLDRRLNPRWRMTLTCNLGGLAVMGWRFVTVRLPEYGIDESFEVQGQPQFLMGDNSTIVGVQIEVIAMDATAYQWDATTEEGTPPPVPDGVEDDDDLAVPTGFSVTTAIRNTAGQPFTYATLKATAPAREDNFLYFEISSDGGGTWMEVPHERDSMQAEYGPLNDNVNYLGRARTITSGRSLSDPTTPSVSFSATNIKPATPVAFAAPVSGTVVSLSVRAAETDTNTRALQFRRGTLSQTFEQATLINRQLALGGDVRSFADAPPLGDWRYWATAENSAGGISDVPVGPIVVTVAEAELITNGTFATDTSWQKPTGGTISGGVFTKAAGTSGLLFGPLQAAVVAGGIYRLVYTIVSRSGGTVSPYIGGTPTTAYTTRSSAGTFSQDLQASGTPGVNFAFNFDAAAAMSIDNVSLRRVG